MTLHTPSLIVHMVLTLTWVGLIFSKAFTLYMIGEL